MKKARRVIITESIQYEVGTQLKDKGIITEIRVLYPLIKIFVEGNAIPVIETVLQPSSGIEWLQED